MQVWKFPLPIADHFGVEMPDGAKLLSVQTQSCNPCLCALVDPKAPKVTRWFRLAGTGHEITADDARNYVGTFQLYDGGFLGHVFETTKDRG